MLSIMLCCDLSWDEVLDLKQVVFNELAKKVEELIGPFENFTNGLNIAFKLLPGGEKVALNELMK